MKKLGFITLVFILLLQSCKTSQSAVEKETFSAKDYPYIEKFHEGVRLKTKGQINEAIAVFNECLALNANDDAVYYALSELHLMKKEQDKSIEYITKAAQLDPNNIWYTQELAYMYFEKGKFADASKNFEKLVKKEPRNIEWLYGYAESLEKSGKTLEAIKALDKTEDQVGKHPELAIHKFKLYVQLKQIEKAIAEIERAQEVFPNDPQLLATLVDYYFQTNQQEKAVVLLEKLVLASPENGRAHLALADIYRQQNQKAKAYRELKMAFLCEDIDVETKVKILVTIHESSKTIDPEVMELVELLVKQHPNDARVHSVQGDYLLRADQTVLALAAYKNALVYDKTQYPIWKQVLIMEYQEGQFEALYTDSKTCLEYFTTIPLVYLLHGISAVQLKKDKIAIETLQNGLDLVANDKEIESEMLGQIGIAYFRTSQFEDGKKAFEKAITLSSDNILIKNNYAYQLAMRNMELDKALKLINEVMLIEPNAPHFIDTKGFILFQKNQYSQALELFQQAYALSPTDKVIIEHMGDVYFKEGNTEKALIYWRKAKDLGSVNLNLDKKIENKEYYDPSY